MIRSKKQSHYSNIGLTSDTLSKTSSFLTTPTPKRIKTIEGFKGHSTTIDPNTISMLVNRYFPQAKQPGNLGPG